jgi:hypothetical protein
MVTIEEWIKRELTAAVAAGIGKWAEEEVTELGRPVYKVTDGGTTLVLLERGLRYGRSPNASVSYPYTSFESITLVPLIELMKVHRNLEAMVTIRTRLRPDNRVLEIELPVRVYSSVATVLARIVNDLAKAPV